MSKSNRVYVIVVLEDARQQMLARRYLKKRGVGEREMRIERSPSGEGNAEGWVRKTFVKEVSVYRGRQAKTALIVLIDADNHTVQDRWRQLDQALLEGGKQGIEFDREQIARLIPKRNVGTWILCLNEQPVNEETDYKRARDDWNELIPQAAETLFQLTYRQAALPNWCTESLQSATRELKHLEL